MVDDPKFREDLAGPMSASQVARKWGIGKTTVVDYRRRDGSPKRVKDAKFVEDVALSFEQHGREGRLSTGILPEPLDDLSNDDILRQFGRNPEKHRIVGTLGERHWLMNDRWNHWYAFKTELIEPEVDQLQVDPVAVLAALRAGRPPVPHVKGRGDSAFCLSINDIQLGQSYNGGSGATIEQFHRFVSAAKARIAELRSIGRLLDTLVVVCGGDLVEGCVIYPNQAYSLDLDRKHQIQGVVALLLHTLDELAPLFPHVTVLACKGNHGENRVDGKYTTLADNDDTLTVEMTRLALARDRNMRHIQWVIADEEAGVTARVKGWVLGTTHGDVFAKNVPGATIDKKAQSWFKNMAAARRFGDLGLCDVLVTHHFHHDKMSDWGSCLWRQTPSQDRGSPYFEQASGEYSLPGMLTWVMSSSCRWSDELVLR
jgi:hypothetical protein